MKRITLFLCLLINSNLMAMGLGMNVDPHTGYLYLPDGSLNLRDSPSQCFGCNPFEYQRQLQIENTYLPIGSHNHMVMMGQMNLQGLNYYLPQGSTIPLPSQQNVYGQNTQAHGHYNFVSNMNRGAYNQLPNQYNPNTCYTYCNVSSSNFYGIPK